MGQGQLESHGEEQQGNAKFGKNLHFVRGADQSKSIGAHQDSGHQETHQGWSRKTVRQCQDRDCNADEQRQVNQQPCFRHVFSFSVLRVWRKMGRHAAKYSTLI